MSDRSPPRPLQAAEGLRFLQLRLFQNTGEVDTYDFKQAALTALTGPRNSSKTTTLKAIDYCLGDRDGIVEALGAPIAEKYQAIELDLALNGSPYKLTRSFEYGRRGLVAIDDDLSLQAGDLSSWLLQRLGWPELSIPLGRNAATATQLTPLTFRTMLRHIYRREDSWTEFAISEQEYHRRAVVSLFLGFAPQRYETADFALGSAQRHRAAAEAVYRDVLTSTDDAIQALVRELGLPSILDIGSLKGVEQELRQRLATVQHDRDRLTEMAANQVKSEEAVPGGLCKTPFEEIESDRGTE